MVKKKSIINYKNKLIYIELKNNKNISSPLINYIKKKTLVNFYSILHLVIKKKKIESNKIYFKHLILNGLGYKMFKINKKLIINFNNSHWYCLNLKNNEFKIINNNLLMISKNKNEINLNFKNIININKFNYYKGKGLIKYNKNKYNLKINLNKKNE